MAFYLLSVSSVASGFICKSNLVSLPVPLIATFTAEASSAGTMLSLSQSSHRIALCSHLRSQGSLSRTPLERAGGCSLCTGLLSVSMELEGAWDTQGHNPPSPRSLPFRENQCAESWGQPLFLGEGGGEGSAKQASGKSHQETSRLLPTNPCSPQQIKHGDTRQS